METNTAVAVETKLRLVVKFVGAPEATFEAGTLLEIRQIFSKVVDQAMVALDAGNGDLRKSDVFKDGKKVAVLSWNGRAWKPGKMGIELLVGDRS